VQGHAHLKTDFLLFKRATFSHHHAYFGHLVEEYHASRTSMRIEEAHTYMPVLMGF
jgi:hypothetical protein